MFQMLMLSFEYFKYISTPKSNILAINIRVLLAYLAQNISIIILNEDLRPFTFEIPFTYF